VNVKEKIGVVHDSPIVLKDDAEQKLGRRHGTSTGLSVLRRWALRLAHMFIRPTRGTDFSGPGVAQPKKKTESDCERFFHRYTPGHDPAICLRAGDNALCDEPADRPHHAEELRCPFELEDHPRWELGSVDTLASISASPSRI
jgi:hypothetical protein